MPFFNVHLHHTSCYCYFTATLNKLTQTKKIAFSFSCLQIFSYGGIFKNMLLVFSHIQFPANPIVTQKRHSQQTSNKGQTLVLKRTNFILCSTFLSKEKIMLHFFYFLIKISPKLVLAWHLINYSIVISTKGALRRPMTYDNHPYHPPHPSVHHVALNELNRP